MSTNDVVCHWKTSAHTCCERMRSLIISVMTQLYPSVSDVEVCWSNHWDYNVLLEVFIAILSHVKTILVKGGSRGLDVFDIWFVITKAKSHKRTLWVSSMTHQIELKGCISSRTNNMICLRSMQYEMQSLLYKCSPSELCTVLPSFRHLSLWSWYYIRGRSLCLELSFLQRTSFCTTLAFLASSRVRHIFSFWLEIDVDRFGFDILLKH